jgi:hypothetical protein
MSEIKISPDFLVRQKRLEDAFNLKKPDRVPVAPVSLHYYPTRVKGITNRESMYQWDKRLQKLKEVTIQHDWDAAPPAAGVSAAQPWDLLGFQQVKWPGGSLGENIPFQWVEKEYMLQNEYDELLADPNGFAVKKLWPRIATTMGPLGRLFQMSRNLPLLSVSDPYAFPGFIGSLVSQPDLRESLEKLLQLSRETQKNGQLMAAYGMEMATLGYPSVVGAHLFCAYDWLSDCLRGLWGTSMDMYQVPEKLLAATNMLIPGTIYGAISMAKQTGINSACIYLHRGSAGFMSDAQFAKFYWPCLKALIMGLIDAGVRPIVYTEGNYNPRLKYFLELPPKKFVMHYQEADRRLVKKVLGDQTCFWGNISAALLCTGTVQQVEDDVKELVDIFGDNGGLVIDSSVGMPDEAKFENVQAITDSVKKLAY